MQKPQWLALIEGDTCGRSTPPPPGCCRARHVVAHKLQNRHVMQGNCPLDNEKDPCERMKGFTPPVSHSPTPGTAPWPRRSWAPKRSLQKWTLMAAHPFPTTKNLAKDFSSGCHRFPALLFALLVLAGWSCHQKLPLYVYGEHPSPGARETGGAGEPRRPMPAVGQEINPTDGS